MKTMKTKKMKLDGMKGTWYMIDSYTSVRGTYYLWESEQLGEDCPAVMTDEKLRIFDDCCCSGIYEAVQENRLF